MSGGVPDKQIKNKKITIVMTALHKNIRMAIKLECNEFKNWDGWFFLRF